MQWAITEKKYLQLFMSDIRDMHRIELSCKSDPTPIISDYHKFIEYLKLAEVIFVLKANNFVVGYAVLEKEKDNVWYLQNLAIVKEHRGLGWGKLLINLRINYAIQNGATSIYMHCGVLNYPIQNIYTNLGFDFDEQIMNHYGQGKHAYRVSKQLKEGK